MDGPEFIVAIVAIVCGTALVGYTLGKIFGLIKAWINRKQHSYDEETFNRLAKAFTQHKKDTERRLQNLEAIVTEDSPSPTGSKPLKQPQKTIEIESSKDEQKSNTSNNLKNMLRE